MKKLRALLIIILLASNFLGVKSQEVQRDSVIVLTLEEARVLTKMTEDLKWTKAELEIADSIICHKDSIITLKDQMIDLKELKIQENLKIYKKNKIKVGVISGVASIIVGILTGILIGTHL